MANNPPIERSIEQINAMLLQFGAELQDTVETLRTALPQVAEAVDAIEGMGPKTAAGWTAALAGKAHIAQQAFKALPRDEETGQITTPQPSEPSPVLVKSLDALTEQLKRSARQALTGREQSVAKEIKGLSVEQRQQRLVATGELLSPEDYQRRTLSPKLPTPKQLIEESERAQQHKRDVARATLVKTPESKTAAAAGTKPVVAPVKAIAEAALAERTAAEESRRHVPVSQRIAGMTWEQRLARLRAEGKLLTPERVQQRTQLRHLPTHQQAIKASEDEEERKRQMMGIKPPVRPPKPVLAEAVSEPPKPSKGPIQSIRDFITDYRKSWGEVQKLSIPTSEKTKGLSHRQRFDRVLAEGNLLSEDQVRQTNRWKADRPVSRRERVETSEKREDAHRRAVLSEKAYTGAMAPAIKKVFGVTLPKFPAAAKVASKALLPLAILTTTVTFAKKFVEGLWNAHVGLRDFARNVTASNEALARYHPVFANLAATMNRQRILLDYQLARSTSGSAAMLGQATRKMNADLQDLRSTFQTLRNFAGTMGAYAAKPLADSAIGAAGTAAFGTLGNWLPMLLPKLQRAVEKYLGTGNEDTRRAFGMFMGNVNAGVIQARRPRPKAAEKP